MADKDSGFKQFIEAISNIKMVIELLASLGGGALIKALLISLGNIPAQWITPLWLISAGLILWGVSSVVEEISRRRRKRGQTEDIGGSQKTVSLASADSSAEIEGFWKSYDNDLLVEVETRLRRMIAACGTDAERERMLIRYTATREVVICLERIWNTIYESQITVLERLNPTPIREENIKQIYLITSQAYVDVYMNFSYEQWFSFLTSEGLVTAQPGQVYGITVLGREFLKYIIATGKSRTQKRY